MTELASKIAGVDSAPNAAPFEKFQISAPVESDTEKRESDAKSARDESPDSLTATELCIARSVRNVHETNAFESVELGAIAYTTESLQPTSMSPDALDAGAVAQLILLEKPTGPTIHLSARSSAPKAYNLPSAVLTKNVLPTTSSEIAGSGDCESVS